MIIIFLVSCKKEDIPRYSHDCVKEEEITSDYTKFFVYYSGMKSTGFAKAIKINQEWNSVAEGFYLDSLLTLRFRTFLIENSEESKFTSETIYLKILNPYVACYEINNNVSSKIAKLDFFAQDGDVTENIYSVDTNFINEVRIDTFDLANKRVAGKFKCSLIKDKVGTGPWYNPDKLRLFNGEFHCRIMN